MSGIVDVDCGTKVGNAINPSDDDKKEETVYDKNVVLYSWCWVSIALPRSWGGYGIYYARIITYNGRL